MSLLILSPNFNIRIVGGIVVEALLWKIFCPYESVNLHVGWLIIFPIWPIILWLRFWDRSFWYQITLDSKNQIVNFNKSFLRSRHFYSHGLVLYLLIDTVNYWIFYNKFMILCKFCYRLLSLVDEKNTQIFNVFYE